MNIQFNTQKMTRQDDGSVDQCQHLKRELESKADQVRENALIDADTLGQMPYRITPNEVKLRIEECRYGYRQLAVEVGITLTPNSQGILGNHEAKEFNDQLNGLAIKEGDIRKKIHGHPANRLERPTPLSTEERMTLVAPFVLVLLDILFEAPALGMMIGAGVLSYLCAFALNAGKYYFCKFLNRRIKEGDTFKRKLPWIALGLTVFGTIAVYLGSVRYGYLETQGVVVSYGPGVLAMLSFFVSCGIWIAEYFASEVQEKQFRIVEENKTFRAYDDLVAKKDGVDDEIQQVKSNRSARLGGRLITMDCAQSLRQFLEDHYKMTANKFQTVYYSRRPDRNSGEETFIMVDIPSLYDEFHSTNNEQFQTHAS